MAKKNVTVAAQAYVFSGIPVFSVYEVSVACLDAPTQSQKDWIPHCNDRYYSFPQRLPQFRN